MAKENFILVLLTVLTFEKIVNLIWYQNKMYWIQLSTLHQFKFPSFPVLTQFVLLAVYVSLSNWSVYI